MLQLESLQAVSTEPVCSRAQDLQQEIAMKTQCSQKKKKKKRKDASSEVSFVPTFQRQDSFPPALKALT